MNKIIRQFGPTMSLMIIILVIWELVVRMGIISNYILPSPTTIFSAIVTNWDILMMHSGQTLTETLIGLVVAIILGMANAVVLDFSSIVRKSVYPILVTSQTIPMIALAPLLIIWFGFGLLPKVVMVVLYCFFPIAVAVADGFANTDPDLIKLLKSMGATDWQIMKFIKIPNSLPNFFSGLRIAATYSVVGAIVGEYVGAYQGLGIYMQTAANSHAIDIVFAAIAVTTFLSLIIFMGVGFLEKMTMTWKR